MENKENCCSNKDHSDLDLVKQIKLQDLVNHSRRLNSLEEARIGSEINNILATPRTIANDITKDIQDAKKKLLDVILDGRSIDTEAFNRIIKEMEDARHEVLDNIPSHSNLVEQINEMLKRSDEMCNELTKQIEQPA